MVKPRTTLTALELERLRDEFAMAALASWMSLPGIKPFSMEHDLLALNAYCVADAMMKVRK